MGWFYLSFADPKRPAGTQFLGGLYIEAESIVEAVTRSHAEGLNPGGEIQIIEIPDAELDANVPEADRHRLLSREELEDATTRTRRTDEMAAHDWTEQTDIDANAETLGVMVKSALIQAGGFLDTLKRIAENLNNGSPESIEHARIDANNALTSAGVVGNGTTVYTDFKMAWYEAIPRRGSDEPTSFG